MTLIEAGHFEAARALLEQAVRSGPADDSLYFALGVAELRTRRFDAAIATLDKAVELAPKRAALHLLKGEALAGRGDHEAALASYDQSIALDPGLARAHHLKGDALLQLRRHAAAIESYDRAIAIVPDYIAAVCNRGSAFHAMQAFEEALASFDHALTLSPRLAGVHLSRGRTLREMGRFSEAEQSFRAIRQLDPAIYSGEAPLAFLLLLQARLTEGFSVMREAWRRGVPIEDSPSGRLEMAIERGALKGKTILLRACNGLGDTLQFCRYAAVLSDMGAQVLLAPQPALIDLISSLNRRRPVAEVCTEADLKGRAVDHDVDLYLVAALLKTELSTIPAATPYLFADPARIARWSNLVGSEGFRIGICWQGKPDGGDDAGRSFPVHWFEGLSKTPGVRLINLHRGAGYSQLADLPPGMKVDDFGDALDETTLDDTAAVIRNCDLVVSSDTAVAHLSAALGVPTWVALRRWPDWRWMLDRSDSPWYPTMRLFRQPVRGDWASVFRQIEAAVRSQAGIARPADEVADRHQQGGL